MSGETGYHRRGTVICTKIYDLFRSLGPSTYGEISPMIEYWIEYALTKQSVDAEALVEKLSPLAWKNRSSETNAVIARFLKEFRDAPHRSERARSFIDWLCSRVLQWFAAASAEDLAPWDGYSNYEVSMSKGEGFVWAASFVGHLVECGLLDHDLVRSHLIKPLITHNYEGTDGVGRSFRAMVIYQLFAAAKDTLLQGLLEPEDVEACFKTLGNILSVSSRIMPPDKAKLNVRSSLSR